jgi:hypothetical protein
MIEKRGTINNVYTSRGVNSVREPTTKVTLTPPRDKKATALSLLARFPHSHSIHSYTKHMSVYQREELHQSKT